MVFTDSLSHASVSGRYAFVTTIIVCRRRMRHPEFAPFDLLLAHRTARAAATEP